MSDTISDEDVVRGLLEALAAGATTSQGEARAALAAFNRFSPAHGQVLTPHAWCACDHQHGTMTATGQPARHCAWVWCRCPGFRPRSLASPSPAEVEELRAKLRREWAAYDAQRARAKR